MDDKFITQYVVKNKNCTIQVGTEDFIIIDENKEMHQFMMDDIQKIEHVRHHRQMYYRYTFFFSNGSLRLKDDSFEARCLIESLKDNLSKKNRNSNGTTLRYFDEENKKYYIETAIDYETNGLDVQEMNWTIANKKLSNSVHRLKRIECIIIFIIMLFVGGIVFGCLNVWPWVPKASWINYMFWIIFIMLFVGVERQELTYAFLPIQAIEGLVIKKQETVKRDFAGTEDYSVDIVNSEGKCFKDIYCNGSDYEMTVPGKTVFTIVKAGKAKPRVFLDDGA